MAIRVTPILHGGDCHACVPHRLLALKLSPAKVLYGEQVSEGKRRRESSGGEGVNHILISPSPGLSSRIKCGTGLKGEVVKKLLEEKVKPSLQINKSLLLLRRRAGMRSLIVHEKLYPSLRGARIQSGFGDSY